MFDGTTMYFREFYISVYPYIFGTNGKLIHTEKEFKYVFCTTTEDSLFYLRPSGKLKLAINSNNADGKFIDPDVGLFEDLATLKKALRIFYNLSQDSPVHLGVTEKKLIT
jgi:hypothetical protein